MIRNTTLQTYPMTYIDNIYLCSIEFNEIPCYKTLLLVLNIFNHDEVILKHEIEKY